MTVRMQIMVSYMNQMSYILKIYVFRDITDTMDAMVIKEIKAGTLE